MSIPAPERSPKIRTILADDTPDVRDLVRLILDGAGDFEVLGEAANGADAVRECEVHRPDLVLLDLAMPVMDGLEAISEIRGVSPDTRIVVLSGFEAARAATEALQLGADAYLPKGTRPADIVAKLRETAAPDAAVVPLFVAPRQEPSSARLVGRRRDDLVPMLTHELRNQVLVIEGLSTLLIDGWDAMPSDRKLELMNRVSRNASQMHSLVDAFSDASKTEADDLDLARCPVRLGELVRDLAGDLASLSDTHQVDLKIDDDVIVEIDSVRIRQVLTNLLSNAAKFSAERSTIQVTVEVNKRYAEVVVADEGPGIPLERRDELFRPFSRLGVTEKKGTGLGLYISRGIARAHGGDLILAPSRMGACFVLMLPLH